MGEAHFDWSIFVLYCLFSRLGKYSGNIKVELVELLIATILFVFSREVQAATKVNGLGISRARDTFA